MTIVYEPTKYGTQIQIGHLCRGCAFSIVYDFLRNSKFQMTKFYKIKFAMHSISCVYTTSNTFRTEQ